MQQIVIADTSTLLNRALFSSIPDTPYLWNVWLGPTLGQAYLDHLSWRWGYATFAVLLPICAIPLLATLWWNVRKAEKRGLVEEKKWRSMTWGDLVHHLFVELDFPGTLLLTAGFTLLLLPLALAASRPDTWRSSAILIMLGIGAICLLCFILWDIRFAKFPIVTFRLMKNRTVACGCLAGFWYFMAYFIFGQYFQSYLQVARFNSAASAGRISYYIPLSRLISVKRSPSLPLCPICWSVWQSNILTVIEYTHSSAYHYTLSDYC
jgi:MFS family permease